MIVLKSHSLDNPKLNELLGLLEDVRPVGDGWQARCPAHDDDRPSLSVGIGDDGRVLLHCHAGCPAETVIEALGLSMADLMPPGDPRPQPNGKGRIVATYEYRDESGELLFEVCRMDPKGFRQRRPKPGGGWMWSVKGVRRVPYRLPELLESTADTVFIVEGEKDVDRLRGLGLTATCNAGGAGKWRSEYAPFLKDRHVAILPDNDEPGREHAAAVAKSLQGVAASVRMVELPGLPEKGDVSDWLDAGHTADELAELVAGASEWTPATDKGGKASILAGRSGCFSEIVPQAPEWLWRGRLALGTISLIAGAPKTSKSTLCTELAARLSRGVPWPDDFEDAPARDPASTIIVSAEDSREFTLAPRLRVAGADCSRIHWLEIETVAEGLRPLEMLIEDTAAKMVVIDPISAFLGNADSHNNSAVRGALAPLAKLAERTRACVALISHLNKKSGQGAMNRVMGSIGFSALARTNFLVTIDRESGDESRRLFLPNGCNIGRPRPGLAFRVQDAGLFEAPKIEWLGTVETTADEAIEKDENSGRKTSKKERAVRLIETMLAGGPLPVREIEAAAEAEGIGKTTLFDAGRAIGIEKEKSGFEGGDWSWKLPAATLDF